MIITIITRWSYTDTDQKRVLQYDLRIQVTTNNKKKKTTPLLFTIEFHINVHLEYASKFSCNIEDYFVDFTIIRLFTIWVNESLFVITINVYLILLCSLNFEILKINFYFHPNTASVKIYCWEPMSFFTIHISPQRFQNKNKKLLFF